MIITHKNQGTANSSHSKGNKFQTLMLALFFPLIINAQMAIKTEKGLKVTVNSVNIEIQFYNSKTVRVIKSKSGSNLNIKSLSVIKTPDKTKFSITNTGDIKKVFSNDLKVFVDAKTGKVSFYTKTGILLFSEKENGTRFISNQNKTEDSMSVGQSFVLDTGEAIYGLGQNQNGKMNQRNMEITMVQENMKVVVPFFQSIKGYGLFWDNYSITNFKDSLNETSFDSKIGNCVDYYFMHGGNADGVNAEMQNLTGKVPMFPRWTFGYWQSRERYKSQEELVGVVEKYRELKVPIDGIIQDWQYWGTDDYDWNSTEFGNPKFPNPTAMVDKIHALNAHAIISVWPSFGCKSNIYKELKANNLLFNFQTYPQDSGVKVYDAYSPMARDIYWKHMNKNIFSLGMDGWWLDATEPEHMDILNTDYDTKTYLGSFGKVRNAYPLMSVGGVSDHQKATSTDKRVFILTRSAFAGQQRYGATVWSGDVVSSWNTLQKQIPAGLNFSLSGIPYWNTDIGGFFSRLYPNGVNDNSFRELYVRWLQFGTFCSMMRSHGTGTPREIYQFGKKGDWAYDAIEKFIRLRYSLLPYIYSTSWDVTATSSSMMRALMMDFQSDKNVWEINNEYMFGKSILVCPVTTPQYTGLAVNSAVNFNTIATSKVYLPKGTDWYDYWTNKKITGGQEIETATPIDILPLYVKAGSILPLGPDVQYSNEKQDPIEIRIYAGANGTFTLYEDENDNYNYKNGKYSLITFTWNDIKKVLVISDRKGSFKGMRKERIFNIVFASDKKNSTAVIYKGDKIEIKAHTINH